MKIVMVLFWFAFVAACLSVIPEPLGLWINIIGMLLLIGHLIEFYIVSLLAHFVIQQVNSYD